jgi:4-aminobutyrate aminotransferase
MTAIDQLGPADLIQDASPLRPASSTQAAVPAGPANLSPVLGRYFQRTWVRGAGHRLWDAEGHEVLDFACGIAVTALGHAHPRVNAAIHAQVDTLIHTCGGLGYLEPTNRLAAMLADALPDPLDTVFFGNSGAEAVEGAVKLARKSTGRTAIIGFTGAFHGRTYAALSLTTSNVNYRVGHGPLLPDIHVAPFPHVYRDFGGDEARATEVCLDHLERMMATEIPPSSVAAFLIEPVQGEGGFTPAPLEFLRGLRRLADRHGILLIADEVQCGYGRTGSMWAFERAGIVPDIVTLAKAIANGLPLSAVVSRRELHDRWGVGAHGSTYGGNPVACAAGIAVLETIRDEDLVANAAQRGEQLRKGLEAIAVQDARMGDVRGPGLMIGVEFVKDRETREPDPIGDPIIERCADAGLLLLTCGSQHNIIRWIPPLDVTAAEIDEALGIFRGVLAATAS